MPCNNIAKRVKFLGVDGVMVVPILLILIKPSMGMLYFLIFTIFTLFLLEKRGMDIFMLFRRLRTTIVGKDRFIRPPWRKRIYLSTKQ